MTATPTEVRGRERTRSCATGMRCPRCGETYPLTSTEAFCAGCSKCLDVTYDYELAASRLSEHPLDRRPRNIWRFEELLPIVDASAQARVGQYAGFTPLIRADRLGAELGLANLYLKDDSTMRPTLSYKDRVVSMSVARLLELGKPELGCVSTGNVGHSVSALAAKAGVPAFIFYPNRLEPTKARLCRALGAQVCQLDGNYDEANRECRKLAAETGLDFANITLRPFYSEGGKTEAFEIVEQLGFEAPGHLVMPAAGGTLSSRVHKGLRELEAVGLSSTAHTRIHIAQPEGCAPIASAIAAGDSEIHPCTPTTLAHSLAIGAPGDGSLVIDAVVSRGGSAATVSDPEIFAAIDLLGATEGILTEPAGGTAIASLAKLVEAGDIDPEDVVVTVITGNGTKTIEDHPDKPWPETVACNVEAMRAQLDALREAAGAAGIVAA
jgi:threonine synthase